VTETATKPAPPRTIFLTVVALGISAVFGLLATLAEHNATFKKWDFDFYKKADLKSSQAKKNPIRMPSDAEIHRSIDQVIRAELLIAIIGGVVMIVLAYALYRGKYWARWSTVGFWLISTLFGGVAGLRAILVVASDAPLPYRSLLFVCGVAMLAAIVLVNLQPSVAYLSLSRPVRPPRGARTARPGGSGGLGALFRPRPAVAPQPPVRPGKAAKQRVPSKPVATRPASQQSRPRSKPRVDVTAASAEVPADRLPTSRPRGKSRKS
jgi:hypothetical protein